MKRHGFLTVLALAMSFSVGAAQPQSEQPSGRPPTYPPRIAVVMELIQVSHFKLWLAESQKLAARRIRIGADESDLAGCKDILCEPSGAETSAISQLADEFADAIKTKNAVKFDGAFKKFTSGATAVMKK